MINTIQDVVQDILGRHALGQQHIMDKPGALLFHGVSSRYHILNELLYLLFVPGHIIVLKAGRCCLTKVVLAISVLTHRQMRRRSAGRRLCRVADGRPPGGPRRRFRFRLRLPRPG